MDKIKLTEEQIKKVKDVIREDVENVIDNYISYEWSGSDYCEKTMDDIDDDSFDIVPKSNPPYKINSNVYEEFLKNLVDHIYSGMEFKPYE